MITADIEQKITNERTAIAKSQARNAELVHERTKALESGDDGLIDRIESDMRICDTAISRGRDRIAILEQRLEEAKQRERETTLNALAAETDNARVEGELLIAQYREHAAAIAPLLSKLKALDERINNANHQLQSAGREPINSPNAIRCRPMAHGTRTVRRTVGIAEDCHPASKLHVFDRNGNCRHRETGEPLEQFSELDVVEKVFDRGVYAAPLYEAVELPGIDPDGSNIWPNPSASVPPIESPSILSKVRNLISSKAA